MPCATVLIKFRRELGEELMKRLLAGAASAVVAATGVLTANAGTANATAADWAWPGQEFVVYADGGYMSCSVGYPGTDSAGNRFFITAGHCFRTDSGSHYVHRDGTALDIYDPARRSTSIGWERMYMPANDDGYYLDISLVQMRPGRKLTGDGWRSIPAVESMSRVGDTACAVGKNHNRSTCGKVTAIGEEMTISGYSWTSIVNRATYCSYPGDSGGAVYNSSGVLGIVSAGPKNVCDDAYVPISLALKAIRKSIPSFRLY